jgi:2-polyprenyl-3-methyl-5-hydroxy-6-metoxy-1,4-benzoquinol methylase
MTINTPAKTQSTLIDDLITEIISINPLQENFLKGALSELSLDDYHLFNTYLTHCLAEGKTIDYLALCYDLIVKDTFANQLYFKRHNKYKHSSYVEVESLVYRNDDYMSMYMYGLAISTFLWKNHLAIKTFFKHHLPIDRKGHYLEIGPGHGFYMMEAMQSSQYDDFLGVDISPSSVALTSSILQSGHFGDFKNFKVEECDFLNWTSDKTFDAVVMGEVLEHVESPELFLRKIADITCRESYIYVTTCINSPAIDHIYLFRDSQEISEMIDACGLTVAEELLVPYQNTTLETSKQESLPINIALVLQKK